jgi:hypothetical protein
MRYDPAMPEGDLSGPPNTSSVVVHPSAVLPGIPPFMFDVPHGWVLDEAPSTLCVVRRPGAEGDFWPNILIRHDKVPRSVDFERAATTTWAKLLKAYPTAVDQGERIVRFATNIVYMRGVNLDDAHGRALAQMQALFFAPVREGGRVVDFFQIIGTCERTANVQDNMDDTAALVASFRFV